MSEAPASDIRQLVDHLFRHSAGQMVSTLIRIFGPEHFELAEEVVQEAMVQALRQWPFRGVPRNPTAWLIEVAKNRALDSVRRDKSLEGKLAEIERSLRLTSDSAVNGFLDDEVKDDQLRLIFICCAPEIPRDARIALTLKAVGGFGVSELSRAFLTQESTIAQRLVRAKRRIRDDKIPFRLPEASELAARLDSVLEVLYLMFNEGYSAHSGENLVRQDLCAEAIRLSSLLAEHPATALPRVHALAALFFFQAARFPARVDSEGELLLLSEQDRSLWDTRLIRQGLRHFEMSATGDEVSAYHLQSEIAACHTLAPDYESTNWTRLLSLYDRLLAVEPSPVVALNRVIAFSMVEGAGPALIELNRIAAHPALKRYYLLQATRGELCVRLGDNAAGAAAYREALNLLESEPVRRFILKKLRSLDSTGQV